MQHNITIEGRPLFWFHPTVTPDWLKQKNFSELKSYMEKHVYNLVTHYGDKVLEWEVFNEYHDWANIFNHSVDEITELTKFAFDRTKEVKPNVKRISYNCCLWGEYAARGRMVRMDATSPLRNARKYVEDILILPGDVPSPANPPPGCRFHTRCPLAIDICKVVEPPLIDIGNEHFVACHVRAPAPEVFKQG